MKAAFLQTPWSRSSVWARGVMLASLAAGAWALSAGTAQARSGNDVYWSIGVHSPGVAVGVSNAPPVVVHQSYPSYRPYPIYQQPQPVYQQRPIVIQHAPVVVHQPYPYPYVRPIVVAPAPSYHPGRGHGHQRGWDDRRGPKHKNDRHRHDRRGHGHY
ncbi:MAG: hypothetical protein Q8K24_05385 [Hydrogenophaga sp.]|nr:hypothetical protein [Hydrogenophaga sp.]